MTIGKKSLLTVVAAGSIFGGALGGTVLSSATGNAATGTTTTSTNSSGSSSGAPSGTFVPNETASHEAGESAAREAQEDAGQVPTIPWAEAAARSRRLLRVPLHLDEPPFPLALGDRTEAGAAVCAQRS